MENGSWFSVVTVVSTAMTALATVMIWVYARKSHQLAQALKQTEEARARRDDEFREQLSDLYQAIVIATVLSGPSSFGQFHNSVEVFNQQYTGKTPIFRK